MISKTLPLRKIVNGILEPDTGRVVIIETVDSGFVSLTTETPANSGNYVASFDPINEFGWWWVDAVKQPAQSNNSPFWLGAHTSISGFNVNTTNLTSVSSSLQSISSTVIRFSDGTQMTTALGTPHVFSVLPVVSGGTNASSYSATNNFLTYDGTRIVSTPFNQNSFIQIANQGVWPQNTYFVSPDYATSGWPFFASITAAILTAAVNSVVIIYPGTYNENIVLKDQVHLFCYDGVTLRNDTNNVSQGAAACVITDYSAASTSAVHCIISGNADIIKYDSDATPGCAANEACAIWIANPGSYVKINARNVESNAWSAFGVLAYGASQTQSPSASLYCNKIIGHNHIAVDCDSSYQFVEARQIDAYYSIAVWAMVTTNVTVGNTARQVVRVKDSINLWTSDTSEAVIVNYGPSQSTQEIYGNIIDYNTGVIAKNAGLQKLSDGFYKTFSNLDVPMLRNSVTSILKNITLVASATGATCTDAGNYLVYGLVAANRDPLGNIHVGTIQVNSLVE